MTTCIDCGKEAQVNSEGFCGICYRYKDKHDGYLTGREPAHVAMRVIKNNLASAILSLEMESNSLTELLDGEETP